MNSFHALGDPVPNIKVCRKILRSLPERFRAKVVAIEERPEVDEMSFEELVGKLQTFELNHLSKKTPSKPCKGIAFATSREEPQDPEGDSDDLSQDEMSFFAKRYMKFMKSKKTKPFVKNSSSGYKKEQKGVFEDKG